jgi:hypothetical protein
MSELDDFLTPTLARQLDAEQALINGIDPVGTGRVISLLDHPRVNPSPKTRVMIR